MAVIQHRLLLGTVLAFDFEDRLTGSYRTWEYCVQYRETDFNFVSRLMEQEGIYYFFIHEDGKHKAKPRSDYELVATPYFAGWS